MIYVVIDTINSMMMMMMKSSAVHVHNTRSADNFHLSFFHYTLRLNRIRHAGPRIWNNLPHDLKVACSLSCYMYRSYILVVV